MNKNILVLFLFIICGCSVNDDYENATYMAALKAKKQRYNMTLADYVEHMSHELLSNISYVKPDSVIAVVSFVYLDSDYFSTPIFAEQIRESFTYEIHKIGQPVLEYQATGYIRVTETGNFALSKDFTELKPNLPIDYILAGTISKLSTGIQVNAKLVGAQSLSVVAAAQQVIPQYVIDDFIPSTEKPILEKPQIKAQKIKLINK